MISTFLNILLFCMALSCGSVFAQQGGAPKRVREARNAVFNLQLDGEAICTVFAVVGPKNERYMMSAGHCVNFITQANPDLRAFDPQTGATYRLVVDSFAYQWPQSDRSIFHYVKERPEVGLVLTGQLPTYGDETWEYGGPKGYMPFLSGGVYSGESKCGDALHVCLAGMYLVTGVAAPGSSGGPVLDKEGRVWGIVTAVNFQVPGALWVVKAN